MSLRSYDDDIRAERAAEGLLKGTAKPPACEQGECGSPVNCTAIGVCYYHRFRIKKGLKNG